MKKRVLFFLLLGMLVIATHVSAESISITDITGLGPAGGYLPLSVFSIAPIAGMGDDTFSNFNVPAFTYAGRTWNRIGIESNGYIVVGGATNADTNFFPQTFPNPGAPNNVLAPHWTDLNPGAGGAVRLATLTNGFDDWIVVDWDHVKNFSNSSTSTFEVWIGMNGDAHPGEDIVFSYGLVSRADPGSALNVGAEDITGTVGCNYSGDPSALSNHELRVSTYGFPVTAPEPSTMLLLGYGLVGLAVFRRNKFFKK